MRFLYFDCFSGISGDMALGALADLGADLGLIENQLNSFLPVPVTLKTDKVLVSGISAVNVSVDCTGSPRPTRIKDIYAIIGKSRLLDNEIAPIISVFNRIAECEASIHGVSIDDIHFHEIGAIDTLVDVIGFYMALKQLRIDQCYSSPVPLARGILPMHHGAYPLPAPAALALLKDVACYGVDTDIELVTPTGAALLTSCCSSYGPVPPMTLRRIGYGAGKSHRHDVPNVLRVILGETVNSDICDEIGVLETNIDDMNPELFSRLYDKFFSMPGALDISVEQIIMKKNRPGFKITCLVTADTISPFSNLLLSETTTIGVRYRTEKRVTLPREVITISTKWGDVQVKAWTDPNGISRYAPEYDSCKDLSESSGVPVWLIYEETIGIARESGKL